MQQQNRQLAAILFTDIVGYTAMMQQDEQNAVAVTRHYITVLKERVTAHGGVILNDYGDGSLCTFTSATAAIRCAIEIQQQLQAEPKVLLRIGLHIGEIFFEEGKVMGDGVNIASRIQSLGQANTILFSKEIFDKLRNQGGFQSVSLGLFEFKNVDEPMEVFALANEGLTVPKRENMEGKLKEVNKNSGRKNRILVAAVVFLLVIGFLLYKQFFHQPGFTNKEKSIAILPFKEIGNNVESMSEGLVEDILVHLSRISELTKVISNRSSSMYANTKKSPSQIGEELGVNSLVTGSIQKVGDTIVVIAQLIDSKSGNTLWANKFTEGKKQIFDLEADVSSQLVNALKAKLTPQEEKGLSKRYTENPEAYNFYNKGRSFWTRGRIDSAEANYRRAIDLDASYAKAYAALAECYIFKRGKGLSQFDVILIAKQYAEKALSLDSGSSEGFTALGFIQQNFLYEWAESGRTLKKAIALDPNYSFAHFYYGNLLQFTGNTREGLAEVNKALELDPLSRRIRWALARNYYFAGENDLAISECQKNLSLYPNDRSTLDLLGFAYLAKKFYSQAGNVFDQLKPDDSSYLDNSQVIQSYAYAVMGDKAKAKTLLEKTLNKYPDQSRYRLAQVYLAMGNFDEAMNKLEQGYENRDLQMFWLKADPAFNPLRNEPRFKALMKKMQLRLTGLPEKYVLFLE